MSRFVGPLVRVRVSCAGCGCLSSLKERIFDECGPEYYCHQPGVIMDNPDEVNKPRLIGVDFSSTPNWCPYYPSQIVKAALALGNAVSPPVGAAGWTDLKRRLTAAIL